MCVCVRVRFAHIYFFQPQTRSQDGQRRPEAVEAREVLTEDGLVFLDPRQGAHVVDYRNMYATSRLSLHWELLEACGFSDRSSIA